MARRVIHADEGSRLVLDAQPLSLLADQDRRMMQLITVAERAGFVWTVSAVSLAEVRRTGQAGQRLRWLRSKLIVVPVTEAIADRAASLLESTGLDGHGNVVDALVVATAAESTGHAKVISTDGSHIPKLCHAASANRRAPVEFVRV